MRKIKLFELLQGITKEELDSLGDFINWKIFKTNRHVITLYNFLKKNYQRVNNGSVSKAEIYSKVFKSRNFSESKYWKLTSAFSTVLDKFLVYKEFEKDTFYQKNLLLENYRKRNLPGQFLTLANEYYEDSRKEFNKSINFFANQSHFYFQKVSYLKYDEPGKLWEDTGELFESLRMFFIMTHLVSISIISNFDKDFIDYCRKNVWMFDEVLSYLHKNKYFLKKKFITVYVFYLILCSKIHPEDENYFLELKELVVKSASLFSGNFLRHILLNMLDYAVRRLESGDERYLREIFGINRIMANESLTFYGEHIPEEYFYSVVERAAELKEINWAKEFMDKYEIYLMPARKETVVNLALSKIHFAQDEFDDSLRYLLKVNNINPFFYIAQKILLLQNYLEKGESKSIKHVLETLNKYLKRRSDIPVETEDGCRRFLHYYKKVLKFKNSSAEIADLQKLKNEKYFMNKPWLVKKMITLMGGRNRNLRQQN